ncbi:MAG TPA: DUF4277 domain-containing protein [Dehalococcoidia bacterium]|nr:DUF4277 domain-containing protein [Dehalococcoidia bacterium]
MDEILAFRADYYPLLGKLMDQMGLVQTINATLKEEVDDALLDTGTVIGAMIHNLLGDGALRLYKLQDFFSDKALPLLFPWSPQLDPSQLNDDRAARALDRLWEVGPQKVFNALSQRVIEGYTLDLKVLHVFVNPEWPTLMIGNGPPSYRCNPSVGLSSLVHPLPLRLSRVRRKR